MFNLFAKGAEDEGTKYASMQVCKYASMLLLMALLSACAEGGDGGDYSDFVYNGPENGICLDSSYDGPSDDYSREPEGICIIDGEKYLYRYNAINRFLAENEEARKITGLEGSVDNCYDAGLAVAAKRYLLSREEINYPDVGHIPPGQETPPDEVLPENTSDDAEDIDDSDIEPLIWKGSSVTYAASENVIKFQARGPGGNSWWCSGIIINENWILTAAHCVQEMISSGDAGTCSSCLKAYWTDPVSGNIECITDTTPNNSSCGTWKTVWVREHENYTASGDENDDIALIYYSTGWNESISEARLYYDTPSTSWPYYYGLGFGILSMYTNDFGVKRRGSFDLNNVYSYSIKSDADDDYRFCKGDSGGVWQKWTGLHYLTFGIHSNSYKAPCSSGTSECYDDDGNQKSCCAAPNGADQFGCRVDRKISWIRDYTGLTCPASSSNGYPFVRCNQ